MSGYTRLACAVGLLLLFSIEVSAQDDARAPRAPEEQGASAHEHHGADATALAKQTQNPGAPLASVPFQFNFNGNIGAYDRTQLLLNIQPVLPVALSKTFALITRWILPALMQPELTRPSGTTVGFGDLNAQLFLAANLPSGLTLAGGAALVFPTATDTLLGQGKFALGPSVLAAYTHGLLVAGALVYYVGSVAGDSDRAAVELLSTQVFVNINLPGGAYLVTAPIITHDFKADATVVPLGGGVGKLFLFGQTPVNINAHLYANVVRPDGAPGWQFRTTLQFLYPQPAHPPGRH